MGFGCLVFVGFVPARDGENINGFAFKLLQTHAPVTNAQAKLPFAVLQAFHISRSGGHKHVQRETDAAAVIGFKAAQEFAQPLHRVVELRSQIQRRRLLGAKEAQRARNEDPHFVARNHGVEEPVLQQKLAALKPRWQFLADRLLDDEVSVPETMFGNKLEL